MRWLTLSSQVKNSRKLIKMNLAVKKRRKKNRSSGRKPDEGSGRRSRAPVLILLALLAAVSTGAWWALGHTSYFSIRKIEVVNNHNYSAAEIIEIARLKPGENIFCAKLSRYRQNLTGEGNIREAVIERCYPDSIRIKIYEREPRARVKFGRYYTIDAWGEILSGRKENAGEDLPVISGLRIKGKQLYPEDEKKHCLALLQELDRTGLGSVVNIREIKMGHSGLIIMRTDRDLEIKLKKNNYRQQLQRLSAIMPHLEKSSRPAQTVDLRFSQVPVAFAD